MPQLPSIRNNEGFTILELLVAMVIMTVGMFGVLETINVSMQYNLKNELRNEAIKVGERYMSELRGKNFGRYSSPYTPLTISSKVRGGVKPFVVQRDTQTLASDSSGATSKQLTVTVKWAYRNVTSLNRVVSVVARP